MKLICKGCSNSGKNHFGKDGFCVCALGREMKAKNDEKVDEYLQLLCKKDKRLFWS